MFYNAKNITSIDITSLDMINIKNTESMFAYCNMISDIDISSLNMPDIENMERMFYSCRNLEQVSLPNFNSAIIENMSFMFAYCGQLKNIDFSNCGTFEAQDLSYMFYECGIQEVDFSECQMLGVTNAEKMFSNSDIINVAGLDTSSVINASFMFSNSELTSINLKSYDLTNAVDMSHMFASCSKLRTARLDNTSLPSASSMSYMFSNCEQLSIISTNNLYIPNVEDMSGMFDETALKNITLNFDMPNVINISYMFANCESLESVDFSRSDTSKLRNVSHLFEKCKASELRITSMDTSSVENMSGMFQDCSNLRSLILDEMATSNVTDMSYMFNGCKQLIEIPVLTQFDTSNVTDMSYMFGCCQSVSQLDLSSFSTASLIRVSCMFESNYSLHNVLVSSQWETKDYSGYNTFNACFNIIGGNGTKYSSSQTSGKYAVADSTDRNGYFTLVEEIELPFGSLSIAEAADSEKFPLCVTFYTNSDEVIPYCSSVRKEMFYQVNKNDLQYNIEVPEVFSGAVGAGWEIAYWTIGSSSSESIWFTGDTVPVGYYDYGKPERLASADWIEPMLLLDLYAHWQRTTYPVSGEKTIDFTLIGGQQITFEDLPEGTTYTIVEKTSGKWSLVSSTNTSGTIAPGENTQSHFINQPAPQEALIELPIVKTLNGEPAEGFFFEIYENDTLIDTQQSDERGSASFKMRYEQVGSHTYKIKEKVGDNKSIIYDDTVYEVYVEVSKDNTGKLVAQLLMPQDNGILSFENETHADRCAEVSVAKNTIGFDLEDKQFAFSMTDTETGNVAATARNDADGTVSFSLTYPNTGETLEKTYEIREIATDDMMLGKDIKYDDKVIRVKVSFIDDAATPTITFIDEAGNAIDETSGMPTFTNTLALNLPFTGGELALISLLALLSVSLVGAGIFVHSRRENTQAAMSSE